MLKLRKQAPLPIHHDLPLALGIGNRTDAVIFDASVVTTIRHMLTRLSYNGGVPSRVAFTSAISGEGVTYTTLAVATLLASDVAARVGVVELNWWNPGLITLLSRRGQISDVRKPGLADVFTMNVSVEETIIPTSLPNLSLIAAGSLNAADRPNISRSQALRECIEKLAARFDYLMLDVPPILVTSDSITLASLSQHCCVVVRQGVTPARTVQMALDDIKHLEILGVVMSQVSLKTPQWIQNFIPQE